MAGGAFNVVVRGCLPALVKRLHVVTGIAKRGVRGVFYRCQEENKKESYD